MNEIKEGMKEQYIWINTRGTKRYYSNKQMTVLNREDGPAVEFANGFKEWHVNGKLHREDGPAFEYADVYKSWWVNGLRLTEEEFNDLNKGVVTFDEIAEKFDEGVERRIIHTLPLEPVQLLSTQPEIKK